MISEIVVAFALAAADGANSLQIADHFGLSMHNFCCVELDLLEPSRQQVIRPLAGEHAQFPTAHVQVVRDARRFGRTATIKIEHCRARPLPVPPPLRKPTNEV